MRKLLCLAALVAAPLSVQASNCGYAAAVVAQAYVAPVAYVVQPAQAVVAVQAYSAPVVQQHVAVQAVAVQQYVAPVVAVRAVHAKAVVVQQRSAKVVVRNGLFNRRATVVVK